MDTEKCDCLVALIFFSNCSFSSHSRSLSVLPSRKRSRCPSRCCCRLDFRLLRGRQKIGGRHRFCPIGVLKDAVAAAFGRICSLTAAAIAQLLFCPRSLLRLRAWPARADASFCDLPFSRFSGRISLCDLPFSRFSGRISQSGCAAASISQSGCGAAVGARLYAAFVALVPAAAVVRTKIRAVAAAASSGLTVRCWLEVVARGGDRRRAVQRSERVWCCVVATGLAVAVVWTEIQAGVRCRSFVWADGVVLVVSLGSSSSAEQEVASGE